MLKILLLLGGAAARVTLETISRFESPRTLPQFGGSNGYGHRLEGSVSDGRRIGLFGVEEEKSSALYGGDAYFLTVGSAGELDSELSFSSDHPWEHATLCDNHALFVEEEATYPFETSNNHGHGYLTRRERDDVPIVQVGYFLDDCDDRDLVVLYDTKELANYREEDGTPVCSLRLDRELGWSRATSFALSEKSATAYVVGRHKDSDHRAVAAVKMEEDRCEVIWHANIATDEGTPRILAVNNDDRVEILLTSNEFFARVDRGTSSREGGDVKTLLIEKQLWLPGEGEAIVAYSDAEDVIFSAGYVDGKALLRASSADTGGELYEIDFTAELDAQAPGTSGSDYPEDCYYDDETLDCGGSTCDGYAAVDGCSNIDDEDDVGVCCQSSRTWSFQAIIEWAENRWVMKFNPEIEGIHVLGDKVAVVGAFKADLYDEDGSHSLFVALFEPTPSDACAGLAKKTCKKTAGCAYKQKTCSASVGDACSGLAKKTCKNTKGCSYKKQACTSCASYASKKDCKKHKKSCKWKKKKEKCLGKK